MPSYITEKYAGILTKEDISQLFNRLTEMLGGNRSEAVRQCNLTGKATYDWEKAKYLKLATKEKVLDAILKIDFLNTVEYLFQRSSDRTVDILRTILSTVYNEAMETNSATQFKILFGKFEALGKEHRGLINDEIRDEVADMFWSMKQRTPEFGMVPPERSIEDSSLKEWLDALSVMVDAYLHYPQEAQTVAKTLDLPTKSVEILWQNFEKLRPVELATKAEGFYIKHAETVEMWVWPETSDRAISSGEEPLEVCMQRMEKKRPLYATDVAK